MCGIKLTRVPVIDLIVIPYLVLGGVCGKAAALLMSAYSAVSL